MKILDTFISTIAPYECLGCTQEGALLCKRCIELEVLYVPSSCYMCAKATKEYTICPSCLRKTAIRRCLRITYYDEHVKSLLWKYKFERGFGALKSLQSIMEHSPVAVAQDVVVTYVPSAPSRIRIRGYDHAKEMAKSFAKVHGVEVVPLLRLERAHQQVGASKKKRLQQAAGAYSAIAKRQYTGRPILVFDDIITTGATLSEVTKVLKQAGYKDVSCVAFAQADSGK